MGNAIAELRRSLEAPLRAVLEPYSARIRSARLDEKVIRDPIFGFQRIYKHEAIILDSPLMQRLRGISQTSVAYYTYPSAIHTRYEHSLNCSNLAGKVLDALVVTGVTVSPEETMEVRLAALLHDVGHCIFSHSSEVVYRDFPEVRKALKDPEVTRGNAAPGEVINYSIVTSDAFRTLLWEPTVKRVHKEPKYDVLDKIKIPRVAQMIIGMAPDDTPGQMYLADIVNGAIDVDKLDYLTRDSYFTGVNIAVDLDRLMPSLLVSEYDNVKRGRTEKRLAVDYRGISVVEQMLFARMLLYDSVYHHHKVRAAIQDLVRLLRKFGDKPVWPTLSRRLASVADLLQLDEADFFGSRYRIKELQTRVTRLRMRELSERALVIHPRVFTDAASDVQWGGRASEYVNRENPVSRRKAEKWFRKLCRKAARYARASGAIRLADEDVCVDIPEPPGYTRLGESTIVHLADDCVLPLKKLFPFEKVVSNYSEQYKYRSYVFAPAGSRIEVAYGFARALAEEGVALNDLAFILAHSTDARTHMDKAGIPMPDWRKFHYAPPTEG